MGFKQAPVHSLIIIEPSLFPSVILAAFPSILALQATAFALILVDLFGWRDSNVHGLTAELLLHAAVVGVWFSLNSMGHHVWKIILSKVGGSVSTSMHASRCLLPLPLKSIDIFIVCCELTELPP